MLLQINFAQKFITKLWQKRQITYFKTTPIKKITCKIETLLLFECHKSKPILSQKFFSVCFPPFCSNKFNQNKQHIQKIKFKWPIRIYHLINKIVIIKKQQTQKKSWIYSKKGEWAKNWVRFGSFGNFFLKIV